jgi:hypothetical protein
MQRIDELLQWPPGSAGSRSISRAVKTRATGTGFCGVLKYLNSGLSRFAQGHLQFLRAHFGRLGELPATGATVESNCEVRLPLDWSAEAAPFPHVAVRILQAPLVRHFQPSRDVPLFIRAFECG